MNDNDNPLEAILNGQTVNEEQIRKAGLEYRYTFGRDLPVYRNNDNTLYAMRHVYGGKCLYMTIGGGEKR